ncbi:hypothetical protein [Burkholderia vietnamiensis]|nr:hypothetical protein [Burkholderia vietnamiensis]AJY05121.1 putative membrane protein [Burkholderia vietnamiensis LMG 10929]AOK39570.1 hypothetical protein WL96_00040 [Burkholderia vietnamiensis]KVF10278.1 hypothetical protein WJ04_06105 [Burkholderia vietnamiensis]KVG00873.1 hypothetical protein WJ21_00360 [Burkholderia vietnamiensis]KVM59755.1 hypothetical protein WJ57_02575 [Burkholderia vietnamiensis]
MSMPIFVVLLGLFVCSALLIIVNLTGDPGIDYWDLDGENEPPTSKLDVLRNWPVFCGAGVVLIATFVTYHCYVAE